MTLLYIGRDIWFQDDFRESSLLCFQSSFLSAWCLEGVLASIPWWITSWEFLSGFCPARFGILFCSLVLGCRYTHSTARPSTQRCQVAHLGCVWVWHCWSSICCSSMLYNIRCNPMHLLKMPYLHRMSHRRLHAVPWLNIGVLMRSPAAEPRSTAGLLFPSQCPSGTFLLISYSIVWDWRVSRWGPMFFYWPKLPYPYYILRLFFHFSSFCL